MDNGFIVVLYVDRFDFVVVVVFIVYVGLVREKEGWIGFVYLFEYLFFFELENLGKGGFDKFSVKIGGLGVNGLMSCDSINYF